MTERHASMIVADELLTSMNGKQVLSGIYTADIVIPYGGVAPPQLVFYFIIETDINDPFDRITIELALPGEPPISIPSPQIEPPPQPTGQEKRSRQILRVPALLNFPRLNAGKIHAKIIHDKGEINVAAPWIVDLSATGAQPTPSA